MKSYSSLRVAHPTFFFKNYDIEIKNGTIFITYHFEIENLSKFSPTWEIPCGNDASLISEENFKAMVFNLGMAELVSYWKITCSPTVKIECGSLSPGQINWWKKL